MSNFDHKKAETKVGEYCEDTLCYVQGRTIGKLTGGVGEVQNKKYSRKGNSCTPINPKKYSCYGLK